VAVLVLDIEAVVDDALWTPPADKPDAFAPPFAWRPICIGLALLDGDASGLSVRKLGVLDDAQEPDLLRRIAQVGARRPHLVTWNGRAYDLPVLMMRSLRYGIVHPWYYGSRDMRYRYTEDGHCDLKDAMGDFGAVSGLHLDGMAKLIGLPGKFGEINGAGVAAAYAQGRLEEIGSYCMGDAVQTAFLWLRWQLLKGEATPEWYRAGAGRLLEACAAEPRLKDLAARVEHDVLLLEQREKAA
jgi:predicted PolB exonuclease-like 3'-5' exonuclease